MELLRLLPQVVFPKEDPPYYHFNSLTKIISAKIIFCAPILLRLMPGYGYVLRTLLGDAYMA